MKYAVLFLVCVLITACRASPERIADDTSVASTATAVQWTETPTPKPTATPAPTPTPTPEPVSPYILPDIVVVDEPGGDQIRTWIASMLEGTSFLILNARPGAGYRATFMLDFSGGQGEISYSPIWAYAGAEHIYDGNVWNYETTFDSDPEYPLTFKLVMDEGYVYLSGRGTVTTKDGETVSLGMDDTVDTWLPKLTSTIQIQREGAAQALGWLAKTQGEIDKVVPALIEALKDPAMPVRRDAAEALGRLNDPRAVNPLYELLSDADAWVADVAVEALQKGGAVNLTTEQITPLIDHLTSTDQDARLRALRLLGATKNELAYEPLNGLLTDADLTVRAEVAKALGAFGDQRSLQPLIDLLADESAEVRSGAALGLGALGSIDAVDALILALADADSNVRVAVAEALGMLGDARAIAPLEAALQSAEYTNEQDAIKTALEKLRGQ